MVLQNFIVFEGIDGAGTSTQIEILRAKKEAEDFLFTSEPTSGPTGKFLRQMLKGDFPVTNESAAYLFAADRSEHIGGKLVIENQNQLVTGIAEACKSGRKVVSDRYFFSSLAYQSISCPPSVPRLLNSNFPLPALLFYFDIQAKDSLARLGNREYREIYEKEDYLNKVVKNYKEILQEYPASSGMKTVLIDAKKSKKEIAALIWAEISSLK